MVQRLKNIDFLKFLLILVIVFYHTTRLKAGYSITSLFTDLELSKHLDYGSTYGNLACDMFFIITGFFLFLKPPETTIFDFIKKKIIRFYPLLILNVILTIILNSVLNLHQEIYKLLFLDGTSLFMGIPNVTWFISVLFWVTLFYYYLYKAINKNIFNIIVFILIFFSYSILLHMLNGNISGTYHIFNNFINLGMLRGLAGIGLGYFTYQFCLLLKNNHNSIKSKILFTLVEIFLIYFVYNNLMFHHINYNSNFPIILGFVGLFIAFVLRIGYISNFLNNNFSSMLGKFVYSIYLTHLFVLISIKRYIWNTHPIFTEHHIILNIIIVIVLSVIFGIIVHYFVEKPFTKIFKKNILVNS